jgi:hypothetical protein
MDETRRAKSALSVSVPAVKSARAKRAYRCTSRKASATASLARANGSVPVVLSVASGFAGLRLPR